MINLSIIVPVHNEQTRLPEAMPRLLNYINRHGKAELLLVENGSTDKTWIHCKAWARNHEHVHALRVQGRGKGAAVRYGMVMAGGAHRYMCDVDLATPLEFIPQFVAQIKSHDVVIGIRPESAHTTARRQVMSGIFRLLVNDVAPGIKDTQCGFKMFTANAANYLFEKSVIDGMAFDVEILYLAQQAGMRICQLPVEWNNSADSRVEALQDSWDMLRDVHQVSRQRSFDRLLSRA